MEEDLVFKTYLARGKSFGLEGDKLLKYVDDCYEREARNLARETEKVRLETEAEKVRLETEAEKVRIEAESEKVRVGVDLEKEKLRLEAEVRMRQLELETRQPVASRGNGDSDRMGPKPVFPKLPMFRDKHDDIDSYLFRFESHAKALKWREDQWVTYLSALLEGSALTLFHSLSDSGGVTYAVLKENLLKKFQCTADGFRKRFREARPALNEPLSTYGVELKRLFDRWVALSGLDRSVEGLIGLFLSEQFLESVSKDLATFIREKNLVKFEDMLQSAEAYRMAHPDKNIARKPGATVFGAANVPVRGGHSAVGSSPGTSGSSFPNRGLRGNYNFRTRRSSGRFQGYRGRGSRNQSGTVSCFLCKEQGHKCDGCPWKSSKENNCFVCGLSHPKNACPFMARTANVAFAVDSHGESGCVSVVVAPEVVCSVHDSFTGRLHLESGTVNGVEASVLRDTGATICGVRRRLVDAKQFTGSTIQCVSFSGRVDVLELAKVDVNCPYLSGEIVCCVLDNPVADLIIGNVPGVSDGGSGSSHPFSMAAVTRARAKHVVAQKPLCDVPADLEISKDKLVELQHQDHSLQSLFQLAQSGEEKSVGKGTAFYFFSNGILCRNFSKVQSVLEQIVVPTSLRPTVLSLAHDQLLAGHCGARRTLARILSNFFWPGITVDVARYVASCDSCQKAVSKGRVPPVPLVSMPIFGLPFDRVAIDLVGPLSPPSENGHRFILTLIDAATRYPEAVPLKDISSVSVADALFSVFSRLGFPKEVLSDQGTQFNSDLMHQFHSLCGCKGIRTSPYHPQANGQVERFHSTLKSMLKKVVKQQPKLWHKYLPALLFACRELPCESTGFSPFELLFGRQVRGPIALLHDLWSENASTDSSSKPLYQYLFDLKNSISESCELAMQNSSAAAGKGKKYFDRRAKVRHFQLGDEVLLLLPTDTNKLLSSWAGPYPIVKVFHPDYKVLVRGKEKTFHANMLKKYVRREVVDSPVTQGPTSISVGEVVEWSNITTLDLPDTSDCVTTKPCVSRESTLKDYYESFCIVGVIHEGMDDSPIPTLPTPVSSVQSKEDIFCIQFPHDIDPGQKNALLSLFSDFSHLFTSDPGCFSGPVKVQIDLSSDVPVRRRHYDLPFASKQVVESEIKSMLELGIIEPSRSNYASPVVLVQKKDGSCRFCIDYRALNKITVFDAEPIPDVEELFVSLADKHFFTKIDLSKGYWQILVQPEDRPKTAFSTHLGLFQFVRMPFGLVSAPAVFARMMRCLELQHHSAQSFFDDILVASKVFKEHLVHLRGVLEKLQSFHLTARPSKVKAGFVCLEFLGHMVGEGFLAPVQDKIDKIVQIPTPTTKKQVRSLLGLLSFYRRYVPNFAALTAPLSDLTKDKASSTKAVAWTPVCDEALKSIQRILSSSPVLLLPKLDRAFFLRTDASSTGIGAVLLQEEEDVFHPVSFASRKLLDRERNYSTIERECLAIVWSV